MPKIVSSKQVGQPKAAAKPKPAARPARKPSGPPIFHKRLAGLTLFQAKQMLGPEADDHFAAAHGYAPDPASDVYLGDGLLRVNVPDRSLPAGAAKVELTWAGNRYGGFQITCDACPDPCPHSAAALDLLLNEKMLLGLAAPPDESVPLELLTPEELRERMLDERRTRAREEAMTVRPRDRSTPWCDYVVTSARSGKTYRVSLRGEEPGQSYCSCPDFRQNRLGTCKHVIRVVESVRKRFNKAELAEPYVRENVSLRVDYGDPVGLRFNIPAAADAAIEQHAVPFGDATLTDAEDAVRRVVALEQAGHDVHVYPDAEAWIDRRLTTARLREQTADIRENPKKHPLRKSLLKTKLLPYQMDGVAFAAGAGRAILADDMGLGKTIQGIGVAEYFAREANIERVLVVCPASLKSQWKDEIERFSDRRATLVLGRAGEREDLYGSEFFTVCNYEQVLRDMSAIEAVPWDLIVLDEGQRIKNWESKISRAVRTLESRFALVLSGTPLENRLDELFTVARFVDPFRLGPAHEFFNRHRVVDEKGKVTGYQRLDELRETLRPILLRRTRAAVAKQLPNRTDTVVRVTPTQEQLEIHQAAARRIAQITSKKYLTEMDLLQLQKAMQQCRMAADGTFLVDKVQPGYSSKLDRLAELLTELADHPDRKIVLFSEWKGMLDRVEDVLRRLDLDSVRLDGSVPQKKRPALIDRFQTDPACRVILMTNAGSTGLNLQSADTVINVDLPWNPAVLEQRIARAYRMGQDRPVHVYNLVTEDTLEERLLDTLASKKDLADASLDFDSDITQVQMQSGVADLKRRLEKLLPPADPAPVDESRKARVTAEAESADRRDRVASAGGELLGAALRLVGELVETSDRGPADPAAVDRLRSSLLESVERDGAGRPQLRVTLSDDAAVAGIAESLAKLLVAPGG